MSCQLIKSRSMSCRSLSFHSTLFPEPCLQLCRDDQSSHQTDQKRHPLEGWPFAVHCPQALQQAERKLASELAFDYPQKHCPYKLITRCSSDQGLVPGGLSTILTQTNDWKDHSIITYASWKLQKHEKNYPPYLLKLQAAIWGMDHYAPYLMGHPFSLFLDHHTVEIFWQGEH